MRRSEVRTRVLHDHSELRKRLDRIDDLSDRFEKEGAEIGEELRECSAALYEIFSAHLALEDAHLVPALEALPGTGPTLANRLVREHKEQRELILFLLRRLEDETRPTTLMAREVKGFADYLRTDMAYEESVLLKENLLSDE